MNFPKLQPIIKNFNNQRLPALWLDVMCLWLVSMCFLDLIGLYKFFFLQELQFKKIVFSCQPYVLVSCAEKELFFLAVLVLACKLVHKMYSPLKILLVVAPKNLILSCSLVLGCYMLLQFDWAWKRFLSVVALKKHHPILPALCFFDLIDLYNFLWQ